MGPEDRFSPRRKKCLSPQRHSCSVAVITRMRRTVSGSAKKKFCVSYLRTKTFCLVRMCQKRALGQLRQPEFATAYYKINFLPTY